MDKLSYALGLGIGQQLAQMGAEAKIGRASCRERV